MSAPVDEAVFFAGDEPMPATLQPAQFTTILQPPARQRTDPGDIHPQRLNRPRATLPVGGWFG
jgi:hypothetical protein